MNSEPLYQGLVTTADDYFRMPDDGFRYELVRGVLVMTPSPSFWHQEIVEMISRSINDYAVGRGIGKAAVAPLDVSLNSTTVYQPDIMFFSRDKVAARRESIAVLPDLVVEVGSPGTALKDLQVKKADYETAGIPEYWIVDPSNRAFRFFVLVRGRYEERTPEDYESEVLPGFRLDAAAFWASLE